jgi:predicted transcriptional regulator
MFEQEIEMETKEGSSFGPILIIFLLVGLFIGGIGIVIFQSKQTVKPEEATAVIKAKINAAAPVTVSFHTGNISYNAADKPSDPQYKLLANAGILKIGKGKGWAAQVDLTPAGKEFLASIPESKEVPDKSGTTVHIVPLATRKLVSVGAITKVSPQKFSVQYTWAWQTTKAGDLFEISGKPVQDLPLYDRSVLIDQHGANYYHGAPSQSAITLSKGDHGWEPVYAN